MEDTRAPGHPREGPRDADALELLVGEEEEEEEEEQVEDVEDALAALEKDEPQDDEEAGGRGATTVASLQALASEEFLEKQEADLILALQDELEKAKREMLEQQMEDDLRMDDLRLENIQLKSRVRKLESQVLQSELFSEYDKELATLCKVTEAARAQVLNAVFDALSAWERSHVGISGTIKVTKREFMELERSAALLRVELYRLKCAQRSDALAELQAANKSLLLCCLSRENHQLSQELERETLRLAELEARAHVATRDMDLLQESKTTLSRDRQVVQEEVSRLRAHTAMVKREREKQDVIDRFVSKHVAARHPTFVTPKSGLDLERAKTLRKQALQSVDEIEMTLLQRNVRGQGLLLAKVRAQIERLRDSVFAAVSKEQVVADALVDVVEQHGGQQALTFSSS